MVPQLQDRRKEYIQQDSSGCLRQWNICIEQNRVREATFSYCSCFRGKGVVLHGRELLTLADGQVVTEISVSVTV
jgi:hypothetical protein